MRTAVVFSLILHTLILAGLVWSGHLSLLLFKARQSELKPLEAVLIDKTYKPTDTAMKYGEDKKDLPPPKVEPKPVEEAPEAPTKVVDKVKPPKETKPSDKSKSKPDLRNILDQLRKEVKDEDKKRPKEDNFPVSEKGEKGATGTGGSGDRALSPAEQALQSAINRHYEMTDRENFKKKYPNAKVHIAIKLASNGDQLSLISSSVWESSGFATMDQQCQIAVQQAMHNERFSNDVTSELNGKEKVITCQP